MKLVLISYNEALDGDIEQILEQYSIQGYTKWTKVYGKGQASEPHLGTHVWPKANNVLAVVTEEGTASKMLESVRNLRKALSREGVKAFVVPCEEIT